MSALKKILILSYFYPPCTLTAAQRLQSFVKYLPEHGFYPIVITRNWDITDNTPKGLLTTCGTQEVHIQAADHETYYLPYASSLRDRWYQKSNESRWYALGSKVLTSISQVGQCVSNKWIPYANLYQRARQLMAEDPELRLLLISGNPFESFRFGYLLQKEFPNLKWIADYRDAWTSSTIHPHLKQFPWKQLNKFQAIYERRWVGSSVGITSVSNPLVQQLSEYTGVSGDTVENGFEENEFTPYRGLVKYEDFTITYVGTLYPGQQIELFMHAIEIFLSEKPDARLQIRFPGLGYDASQAARILSLAENYEDRLTITGRMPKNDILEIQGKSHLLLYVGWKGHEGIIASKVYEYLASGTKILLLPSDDGEVARMIQNVNGGYILHSADECVTLLKELYTCFLAGDIHPFHNEVDMIEPFSRKKQAARLAAFIRNQV